MSTIKPFKVQKADRNVLSVIVPAYKCPTIKRDLQAIDNHLQELHRPYEIICVVDGDAHTQDRTKTLARQAKSKNINVYVYAKNRGKGYAIRYGMARARGDIIAFIDAGSDLHARGISLALEHMKWYDADIIIGSKRHKASKVEYPLKRKILSVLVQTATMFIYGINVSDTQTGLKVFKRKVLEAVLPRLLVKRWAFDLEMLAVSSRLGFKRIYESPIELSFNPNSNINHRAVFNFINDYLAIVYRTYILHYYDNENHDIWEKDDKLKLRYRL